VNDKTKKLQALLDGPIGKGGIHNIVAACARYVGRGATSTTINHHEHVMSQGIKSVVYPVKDVARATMFYRMLLGVEPRADQTYGVAFRVGDQGIE